ncbi:MAG: DUF2384 domain-containing protein [Acidobacteria bacterium]|nr:DUF2384 domain-containing protein [Acidobacteriota bacterium]
MPSPLAEPRPSHELAGVGLRAFFRMAELWGLGFEEQRILLGSPSRATLHRWRKAPPTGLSRDTLERLSYLLGIWKALKILIPEARQALAWVQKPNGDPLFGGRPPLERLLQGRMVDLADVRRHLDAARGIW